MPTTTQQPYSNSNLPYSSNNLCDYLNGRGQPKSGTSWSNSIHVQIVKKFCSQLIFDNISLPFLCQGTAKDKHVDRWGMHHANILQFIKYKDSKIGIARMNLTQNEIMDKYRWCTFVIFRDPRDRELSQIYYNPALGRDNEIERDLNMSFVDSKIKDKFGKDLKTWSDFYSFYYNLTQTDGYKDLFYIEWYDDHKKNPMLEIRKLMRFIGIKEGYLSDGVIQEIVNITSFKTTLKIGNWMHQRDGKNCNFWDKVSEDTIKFMNGLMIEKLPKHVINKINQSCIISV